jgi:glycolate oxidase
VIEACERFMGLGFRARPEALLLAEVDGGSAESRRTRSRGTRAILERMRRHRDPRGARRAERANLWRARKGAFTALATDHPDYYTIDGTIPRRCLPEVLDRVIELVEGVRPHGRATSSTRATATSTRASSTTRRARDLERSEELGARILELCIEVGGTITGEHGVGIEKLKQMCLQFRAPEIAAFHDVKRAFDPAGILNPGKAVPTLNRCAEWGGMHVRGGAVPRPSIPRF